MRVEMLHKDNFTFETSIRNHTFFQDTQEAAGGLNRGPTPKELLLAGIVGCTGMDVVSILKKHNMTAQSLKISGDAQPRQAHPRIFTGVDIMFEVQGPAVEPENLKDAVQQSLTKYCGVSAMVSKLVPIRYRIELNGKDIGSGEAHFDV